MHDVEIARSGFRRLIAANPHHFGTMSQAVSVDFPVVEPKQLDTAYEEIGCVSFSPERDRLETTIVVKRSFGYNGDACHRGSTEWVRFFVDFGSGWVDAGSGAARVFDVPDGKDCRGKADHPYILVVGVPLSPVRKFCTTPVLPRVRAILSWELEPPAGDPNHVPVWGEVSEDTVQIRPRRRLYPGDLVDLLDPVVKLDPKVIAQLIELHQLPDPDPIPDPIGPIALNPQPLPPVALNPQPLPPHAPLGAATLARMYAPDKLTALAERATDKRIAKLALEPVAAHRFAAAEATLAINVPTSAASLVATSTAYTKAGLNLSEILATLDKGEGNTTYEHLECLGLDDAAGQLVATFRVRRPTGFSGPPCSAGSTEYVAFWADLDDDCRYRYLGTAAVNVHDYITMPAGGLSYAAILPLNLAAYRKLCEEGGLHRVRAVLSWNAPPSTTDPDAVPYWGNRVDTHVHVLPGRPYDGHARLTIVGGVATDEIDPLLGTTKPVAHLAYTGAPLDPRGCPFAGQVTVHGPVDPALAGASYRLLARDVTVSGPAAPVTAPFLVVDSNGYASWQTPGAGGWTAWPTWMSNTLGTLGYVTMPGDDLWEVLLEVQGSGIVDTQRFQLDNTLSTASFDPTNAAHMAFDPGQLAAQACGKFTAGMTITGTFDARDTHFGSWGFSLLPTPLPSGALTTSVGSTNAEAPVGSTFALSTSALTPCGYVLRLTVADRAVVNSTWTGRSVPIDIGFCVE